MDKGLVFLGSGFELVMVCVGGSYLGSYIDKQMGWNNYATAFLVIALLIAWFLHLLFLLKRFEETDGDSTPKS